MRHYRGIRFGVSDRNLQLAERKMYEGFDYLSRAAGEIVKAKVAVKDYINLNPRNADAKVVLQQFDALLSKIREAKNITDIVHGKFEDIG